MPGLVHVVERLGADGEVGGEWEIPHEVLERLGEAIEVIDGVVHDSWPVTAEMVPVLQPYVDEPIDVHGAWFVSTVPVVD